MGLFRSDYRNVPDLFGSGGNAKWTTGDAAAKDAQIARKNQRNADEKRAKAAKEAREKREAKAAKEKAAKKAAKKAKADK